MDRLTTTVDSNLLDHKIQVLLEDFKEKVVFFEISEKEEVGLLYNQIFEKFFKTLQNPIFEPHFVEKNKNISYEDMNSLFFDLGQDLEILFRELNFLEKAVVKNFNSLAVYSERIRSDIARIFYEIGVLTLYTGEKTGDVLFFYDSFKNMELTETSSVFYSNPRLEYNIESELYTLPIDRVERHVISNVTIGSLSNGVLGNNQEVGALARNNLKLIADSNPDTWVEYENVDLYPIEDPLSLQLKIELEKIVPINGITLSLLPFGGGGYPYITDIQLSYDGIFFESVMDDIIGPVEHVEDKKAISLEPSAEGSGDKRKILFYPKKARYAILSFWQNEPYLIRSPAGIMNRIAIGIKEVSFVGERYKQKGELVSSQFLSAQEIKFASLTADISKLDGFYDATHFLSPDNGQSWLQVQPVESFSETAPETLVFNLLDKRSVTTSVPVFSLRYKILMERNSENFSSSSGVATVVTHKSELVVIFPGGNSFSIAEVPLSGTFILYNTLFGSAGNEKYYSVSTTNMTSTGDGFYELRLPLEAFPKQSIREESEKVLVNYEVWKKVSSVSTALPTDRVYEFDYINSIIRFGNNVNGVMPNGLIQFGLKKEEANVIFDEPIYIETNFKTDGIKENITIYRLISGYEKTQTLKKKARVFYLGVTDVESLSISSGGDPTSVLQTIKDYINGYVELKSNGDYSVDYENGIIYSFMESPTDSDLVVDVTYSTREYVTDFIVSGNEITFGNSSDFKTDHHTVSIPNSAPNPPSSVIELGKNRVTKNSLIFAKGGSSFNKEVPYQGNGLEFDSLSPTELPGAYTVDYYNGVIYTYSPVTSDLTIEFDSSSYLVHYNIGIEVPDEDITINSQDKIVTLSDSYVLTMTEKVFTGEVTRDLFRCEYDYAQEIDPGLKELEPYVTPYLNDYNISYIDVEHLI